MGITRITKTELDSWKKSYRDSIRDQENETIHCTLFYRELKEFVDYIEKMNQEEAQKVDNRRRIGCVRIYFVRPSREFQSDAATMKFVYNPLLIKKDDPQLKSYPQMRIAMVPVYGVRSEPEEPAILNDYSESGNDFMCLFPGTVLNKEQWKDDIKKRKNERKRNKLTRAMETVKPDQDMVLQIQQITDKIEQEEEKEAGTLEEIVKKQDRIKELKVNVSSAHTDYHFEVMEEMVSEIESLAPRKVELEKVLATSKDEKALKNALDEIDIIRRGENLLSRREELKDKLLSKDDAVQKKTVEEIRREFTNFEVEYYYHTIKEPNHTGEHSGLCPPGTGCKQ